MSFFNLLSFLKARLRDEDERLKRLREAEMYRLGDSDLEIIKRKALKL